MAIAGEILQLQIGRGHPPYLRHDKEVVQQVGAHRQHALTLRLGQQGQGLIARLVHQGALHTHQRYRLLLHPIGRMLRRKAEHHTGLTQLREVAMLQALPKAAILCGHQMLLAIAFVARAGLPDRLDGFEVGIVGTAHQANQIAIVLGDALGLNHALVETLPQAAADKLHEALRALATQALVVLVRAFGRGGSTHIDTREDHVAAFQQRRQGFIV